MIIDRQLTKNLLSQIYYYSCVTGLFYDRKKQHSKLEKFLEGTFRDFD